MSEQHHRRIADNIFQWDSQRQGSSSFIEMGAHFNDWAATKPGYDDAFSVSLQGSKRLFIYYYVGSRRMTQSQFDCRMSSGQGSQIFQVRWIERHKSVAMYLIPPSDLGLFMIFITLCGNNTYVKVASLSLASKKYMREDRELDLHSPQKIS